MAISERLRSFLQQSGISYRLTKHPVVYTAQEIAAAQHVPGRQLAKCVLVNTDRGPALAVLPAVYLVDLKKLKAYLRAKTLTIAKEADIKERFPDVEVGAMSPFGHLYGVPTVIDQMLQESNDVVFNAGSHTETITIRSQDLIRLAKPQLAKFAAQHPGSTRGTVKRSKTSKAKMTQSNHRKMKTVRRSSHATKRRPGARRKGRRVRK